MLEKFPTKAFMPWTTNAVKTKKLTILYQEKKCDYFYLLKIRPKLDIGGVKNPQDFQAHHYFHLLEILCTGTQKDIFIPVIEMTFCVL